MRVYIYTYIYIYTHIDMQLLGSAFEKRFYSLYISKMSVKFLDMWLA